MEFGKVEDLSSVDWTLAPHTALTTHVLKEVQRLPNHGSQALYVGSTGWSQREFLGEVYPLGTRPGEYLDAYGRQFNTIELNTTFYRTPDRAQVLQWYVKTPDDFKFCPKINKGVSQAVDLSVETSRTLDFAKSVQHFEHKLGPCFLQLPSNFTTERIDALYRWLDIWPPSLKLCVELRHESWFSESHGVDAFAHLASRGIGSVITDVAGRRDVAHMNVTAGFAMLRWVGAMHPSDDVRLGTCSERIASWFRAGLTEAYIFTHQPEAVPSASASARFVEFWRKQNAVGHVRVRGPILNTPEARVPAQGQLFS